MIKSDLTYAVILPTNGLWSGYKLVRLDEADMETLPKTGRISELLSAKSAEDAYLFLVDREEKEVASIAAAVSEAGGHDDQVLDRLKKSLAHLDFVRYQYTILD